MTNTLATGGPEALSLYVPYLPSADQLLGSNFVSAIILDLISGTLSKLSSEGEVRLDLLENCLRAPDGVTYRFKLKKGIICHDGEELTAHDIVTMLTDGQSLAIDPSLYLAAIKRTSRYGFDITAAAKGVDVISYLSHRVFAVRRADPSQPSGWAFSGKLKIASWTSHCVHLVEHKAEADREASPRKPLEIKVIAIGERGIDLFHNHPFSYAYLGHTFKEKPISQLTDIKSERTESGYSYLIALKPKLEHCDYIKERLTLASYMAFSRDRSYHRLPLESFFPKQHPLYEPFQKPNRVEAMPSALRITLRVSDKTLSPKLLGSYHKACLKQGIHVSYSQDPAEACDGSIHGFYNNFRLPVFDLLEFFSREPLLSAIKASPKLLEPWRKTLKSADSAKQERFIGKFLKDLIVAGPFVPMFYSFFVVKTNLPVLHKNNHGVGLDFTFDPKTSRRANADLEKFKTEALASLGQAIQMFAHDVKKPFSMMYSMLSLMANIEDGEELKSLSRRYVSEVRGTMDTVTTMLSDIVEIGSDSTVHKEPHSLRAVLAGVFWEVFAYSDDHPVALDYRLDHYHKVHVDAPKITRVLANIIVNACQAMAAAAEPAEGSTSASGSLGVPGSGGVLTFTTKELLYKNQLALQLAIHNTGTFIAKNRLEQIFTLFFTQGKAKGTGLGLAICKKIILEHGGKIWAESDKDLGTTFVMILPIAIDQLEDNSLKLPASSDLVASMSQSQAALLGGYRTPDDSETALANATAEGLPDILTLLKRPIKILIVDDETLYLTLFSLLIDSTKELKEQVQLHTAKNAFQALTMTEHIEPDIIVMDIDLGKLSDDGFEVVRKIKGMGSRAKICIHSNRSWQDDQQHALAAKADFYLPKPMTKANIIRLIANGLPSPAESSAQAQASRQQQPLILAVLDDDPFSHDMLKAAAKELAINCRWHNYLEAEALLADLKCAKMADLDAVLIDYFLRPSTGLVKEGGSATKDDQGPAVARQIKQLRASVATVLMTDNPMVAAPEREPFDLVGGKDPKAILTSLINTLK